MMNSVMQWAEPGMGIGLTRFDMVLNTFSTSQYSQFGHILCVYVDLIKFVTFMPVYIGSPTRIQEH